MSAIAQMLFHRSSRVVHGPYFRRIATVVALLLMNAVAGQAATFTVDTLNDTHDDDPGDGYALDSSNDTSLRAAVEEANALSGADSIIFDVSLEGETIDIWDGEMVVSEELSITGFSAPDQVELNGTYNLDEYSNPARAFLVEEDIPLSLEGLKLVACSSGENGGGVLNHGVLTVTECSFIWCTAINGGGAITTDGDGNGAALDLDCEDVIFFGCASGYGGAVEQIEGESQFSACLFEGGDTATSGGALVVGYQCDATCSDCDFIDNFATGSGGAIALGTEAHVTIEEESLLEENVATSDGGAIWIGPDACVWVYDSTITDNECLEGGNGGGVWIWPYEPHEGSLYVDPYSTISGNTPDDIYPAP